MNIIKIGCQEWTSKNLHLKSFSNGESITNAKSANEWIDLNKKRIPAYCNVDFRPENESLYGLLYNWYVFIDKRPLIEGYRAPSNSDWNKLLEEIIGFSPDAIDRDKYWDLLIKAGTDLKSQTLWESFGIKSNGTNTYGFNAIPAGVISGEGIFSHKGASCSFWSLNADDKYRWHFNIDERNSMKLYGIPKKNWGHGKSIRLIKI